MSILDAFRDDPPWARFDTTVATWLLGLTTAVELQDAAVETVVALFAQTGRCESGALTELAVCDDRWKALIDVHQIFHERGQELPLSGDALKTATDHLLIEMLVGKLNVADAAFQLWSLADTDSDLGFDVLQAFKGPAFNIEELEIEDPEDAREADLEAVRDAVRSLARAVLARGGLSPELVLDGARVTTLAELDGLEA
jgi:hypothetical protein